ncbi:MAG: DNA translocase FtsK [Bdellovibrionales bacterium]|nr:DNA translocase FtsK [Bdellovibrionales bacterium]
MSHLFKRFSRDIIGLVWLSMGIFLALALFSFHPTDPSLNSIGKSLQVQNYCGYIGSFLADILYQLLGLSAWVLVLGNLRVAWKNFRGEDVKKNKLQWVWLSLLLITCASLFSLYWPGSKMFAEHVLVGGIIGDSISRALVGAFNSIGVGIILWTAALILLVFYTEKPLGELFRIPKNVFEKIAESISTQEILAKSKVKLQTGFEKMRAAVATPQLLTAENSASGSTLSGRFFKIRENATEESHAEQAESISGDDDSLELGEQSEMHIDGEPIVSSDKNAEKKRHISLKKKVQRRIENWELPKISMLEDPPYNRKKVGESEIRDKGQRLLNKLKHFNITGEVVDAKPGPAVTMFEYKPSAEVKISRITDLADDLSLELSSESVRIIAPIPGRDVVGIETSNSVRETVFLKEILGEDIFWDEKIALPLALGCEADGSQKVVDLRKMPHMLVAGTTGSGKSVFVVSLLLGLLFRHSPKTLRLILIDPKQVDLAAFSKVPHLLMPPIREPKKAINALRWAIREMEKRYRSMAKFGARDLESFNEKVSKLSTAEMAEHENINAEHESTHTGQSYYYSLQPYTIIIVEEFGDLMSVDKSNVEHSVVRLAQMARACGIHLILAMQSPRKDVVTGLIKTNIPGRVSFKVASKMDSRIILDESGAERLLSRGDMLFLAPGVSKPQRHHGPWVTDLEIQEVCKFWSNQGEPEFDSLAMKALEGSGGGTEIPGGFSAEENDNEYDDKYDEILTYVATLKEVSASHIQTRFRLGYPRAARLIETFEQEGVIGPASGSKKRQVLINELK